MIQLMSTLLIYVKKQIMYNLIILWLFFSSIIELIPNEGGIPFANTYVFLCYENNAGGVVGLGYVGTICHSNRRYRTSITEYFFTDLRTAQVQKSSLPTEISG